MSEPNEIQPKQSEIKSREGLINKRQITKIERLPNKLVLFYEGDDLVAEATVTTQIKGFSNVIQVRIQDEWLEFNAYQVEEITDGTTTVTYTPLDSVGNDPDAYKVRFQAVFTFIVTVILMGCCCDDEAAQEVIFTDGLPDTGVSGIIYVDTSTDPATLYYWDGAAFLPIGSGGGGSQNWQDTLIVGSTLTQHNTIAAGNFDFIWNALRDWTMAARSFLAAVTDAISLRTTGSGSTFLIRHDATTNPLQVDVNSSGGTLWNTAGPTRFIGDTNNEVDLETTGFGDRHNNLNFKATNDTGTDTPNDRGVISFQNNKNDGNGMREWFALRHTDLSTIEVFGLYAYDPANSGVLNRWVICVAAGAFSNPYSNNTFIGQILNPVSVAYPFPNKVDDLIQNGSLILLHKAIDVFNNELLAADNSFANSPIIRFVPRVWVDGDPTELFGAVKHAYVFQQQFSTDAEDTAWQVGFKDAELDTLPALARSFLLKYSGDAQFGAYPSSRNDGTTSIAFYPGPDGELLVGPVSGGGSGTVESVTGLDTDNTDPANPVVKIAVDGTTITGDGTPGDPLVAAAPSVPTLQQVTDVSNITTQPIFTSGYFVDDGVNSRIVGFQDGQLISYGVLQIRRADYETSAGYLDIDVSQIVGPVLLVAPNTYGYIGDNYNTFNGVPGTTEDTSKGYIANKSILRDYNTQIEYLCTDATAGAAVWIVRPVAASFSWVTVTADQSLVVNQGVIADSGALLTLPLPTTAVVGSIIEITGVNTGLFRIAQDTGQIIHFGNIDSTTGATGYVESTLNRDSIKLLCVVADTEFQVLSSVGNFNIV